MPRKPASPYVRVTDICGFVDMEWYKWWVKKIGVEEAERISKESTSFGTGVHTLVEGYLKPEGSKPDTHTMRQKFCAGLIIKWMKEAKVKPLVMDGKPQIEVELISDRYMYRGHPDLIATIGGENWIVDWKTSKDARRGYALQMAAYANAFEEMTGIKINHGAIIRTPSDPNVTPQFEVHEVHNLRTRYFPVFLEALDLYKYFKGKGKWKEVWGNVNDESNVEMGKDLSGHGDETNSLRGQDPAREVEGLSVPSSKTGNPTGMVGDQIPEGTTGAFNGTGDGLVGAGYRPSGDREDKEL